MLCERLRNRGTSVVDEDVAAPERADGIAQRRGIGHIGNGIPGAEFTGSLLAERRRRDRPARSRPIGTKAARNGKSDPLGPAGDHGSETVQRLGGLIAHITAE